MASLPLPEFSFLTKHKTQNCIKWTKQLILQTVATMISSSVVVFTGLLVFSTSTNPKPVEALAPSRSVARSALTSSRSSRTLTSSQLDERPRANNNPFQSMIGDIASSLKSTFSGGSGGDFNSVALDQKLNDIVTTSWEDIRTNLESKQTDEEKAFRSNVEKGIGPPSPLNKIRFFEESTSEKHVRVTLYRDHTSWCPYCQKVWMTLEKNASPTRLKRLIWDVTVKHRGNFRGCSPVVPYLLLSLMAKCTIKAMISFMPLNSRRHWDPRARRQLLPQARCHRACCCRHPFWWDLQPLLDQNIQHDRCRYWWYFHLKYITVSRGCNGVETGCIMLVRFGINARRDHSNIVHVWWKTENDVLHSTYSALSEMILVRRRSITLTGGVGLGDDKLSK